MATIRQPATGDLLVAGCRMVAMNPLLAQYSARSGMPDGDLWVVPLSVGPHLVPDISRDDLGTNAVVMFVPDADAAALLGGLAP